MKKIFDYLAEDTHQEPDHPSTFMKMIKGRANAISTANDERRQVLTSRSHLGWKYRPF